MTTVWRSRLVGLCGLLCLWVVISIVPPAWADGNPSSSTPQSLFTVQCAGCHANGGNIVRRRRTLKLRALERNGLTSVEAIAGLITHGKGAMSAYGDRLTADEIDSLAHYVWERAQTDWK